jgi:hypothetical protein
VGQAGFDVIRDEFENGWRPAGKAVWNGSRLAEMMMTRAADSGQIARMNWHFATRKD